MAPEDHLPAPVPLEAIQELLAELGLPKVDTITVPNVTATYHAIYQIHLKTPLPISKAVITSRDSAHAEQSTNDLILRISGHHLPGTKTRNEVGVMAWLAQRSSAALIPIPDVVAYDDMTNNPIGHEYTLLSKARGATLSDVWPSLGPDQRNAVLDQVIDLLVALNGGPGKETGEASEVWTHIGGLNLVDGQVVPARIVDETFWQTGDLPLWPPEETVTSLNLEGPYPSWPAMVAAQVRLYVRLIGVHDSLAPLRERLVPRLLAFAALLGKPASEHPADWQLANTRLVLAHKDLHFANLLYSAKDDDGRGCITAVLDWEFSGIVPGPLWNPRRAFLWNARPDDPDSSTKTRALVAQFQDRVRARNDPRSTALLLDSQEYASPQQEAMQDVADYLRALVEVCPRGQRQDRVGDWADVVHKNLDVFGV
ncbi:hypothetical protein SEUCBS139899_005327 [Sporothrix eucalyptigena]